MSVVELTYHSHACFSITVGGIHVLIDPFLTGLCTSAVGTIFPSAGSN